MENRVEKAKILFKQGYNCAQSITAAFADMYGLTEEQALRVSASFGGGIGRMRETCGAACGLFILAGLETGAVSGEDTESKAKNYDLVQKLAAIFKERNGSLNCSKLLKLVKNTPVISKPDERMDEYYTKRPCLKIIEGAAIIWSEYLKKSTNTPF